MTTLPFSEVRSNLSKLIDSVEGTHERITITRNGRPAAVIISTDDLEGLEETLEILGNPELMRQIRQAEADVAAGDVLDADELRAYLAEHGR